MLNSIIRLSIGIILLALSAIPSLAGNNGGAAFSIWPDTGQTKCYNDTDEIPCPAPGDPFYGQDAQYQGPVRSYTVLGGGTMIQDNVTGLIWEKPIDDWDPYSQLYKPNYLFRSFWCDPNPDTNGGNTGTCVIDFDPECFNNPDCWGWDTKVLIDQLNSSNFGGNSDWRLPTIMELASLVDNGRAEITIDPVFSFQGGYSLHSATSTLPIGDQSYDVSFQEGLINISDGYGDYKGYNDSYGAMAVRGGQNTNINRYVDNNDGTVTDNTTCLQWQKIPQVIESGQGGVTWQRALEIAENLTLAGKSDWRLPDINELTSLADFSHLPGIDPVILTINYGYDNSVFFWSSTTSVSDNSNALIFFYGRTNLSAQSGWNQKWSGGEVIAVRGEQCGATGNSTWTPSAPKGRLYHTPRFGPPGTIFTESGTGFTPNSTVTLHFRNHLGEVQDSIPQNTDASGNFSLSYESPADKPLGTHTWWAVDDTTGEPSERIGYLITGPPGAQVDIADGSTTDLPAVRENTPYGTLTSEGGIDVNKETFVIVHGWNFEGTTVLPQWMKNMGVAIRNDSQSPAKGSNVLYWNWQSKAKGTLPPYWEVGASGAYLAYAMFQALPLTYAQNIHFIGHSLGTFVSTFAAKFAKETKMKYGNKINHMVFLDSPNYDVPFVASFLKKYKTSIFLENYLSEVGVKYKDADVNIWLTKAITLSDGFGLFYSHSYPYYWYTSSVRNFSDQVLDKTSPSSTLPWGFYWWKTQNRSTAKSQYTQRISEPHYGLFEGSLWDVSVEQRVGILVDLIGALPEATDLMAEQLADSAKAIGKTVKIMGIKSFNTATDVVNTVVNTAATAHAVYNVTYGFLTLVHSSTAVLDIPVVIPAGANALTFAMEFLYGETGSMLEVFVNGNPVYNTTSALAMGEGLKMIPWINVEEYAGQTVTISLRLSNPNENTEGKIKIDDMIVAKIEDPDAPDGDYNNDGTINLNDTILALQVVSGLQTSNKIYRKADVNTDEKIGIEEAIYSLQKVSGLR